MKKVIYISLVAFLFIGCYKKSKLELDAIGLIDKSIEASGSTKVSESTISFWFRDIRYKAVRSSGNFELERNFKKDANQIKDVLSNSGFQRFVNENLVALNDSVINKYAASVNSVHYFSVLPFGLNDAAVNKRILGKTKIKDHEYFKVEVTFNEQGGGEDFEDIFVYWINAKDYTIDYLAYSYNEEDGLGFRFREAINKRYVNGILFSDYNNLKPVNHELSVASLDSLFEADALEFVSKIELNDIVVNR